MFSKHHQRILKQNNKCKPKQKRKKKKIKLDSYFKIDKPIDKHRSDSNQTQR